MKRIAPLAVTLTIVATLAAQGPDGFRGSFRDKAINYYDGVLDDPIARLQREIADGRRILQRDAQTGYLKPVLEAIGIPVESQVLVFSQGSLQGPMISRDHPRALYFNDRAAVGWVRGSDTLEIASQDPRLGFVFYRVDQRADAPRFQRSTECLRCHVAWETFGIPGALILSTGPADSAGYVSGGPVDHRTPVRERWGSWYLTGHVPNAGMGVPIAAAPGAANPFDSSGFLSPHSDIAALVTLEHQVRAMNLIIYLSYEARSGAGDARVDAIAKELAEYFTFADEAPLPRGMAGSSRFAERFAAAGPRDAAGRSLRELSLDGRLLKYPCSYMVYSEAFDALPDRARSHVYAHIRAMLPSRPGGPEALEILKATKAGF